MIAVAQIWVTAAGAGLKGREAAMTESEDNCS